MTTCFRAQEVYTSVERIRQGPFTGNLTDQIETRSSPFVRVYVRACLRGSKLARYTLARRQAKTRVTSGLFEERQRVCIFHNSLAEALRGPMPSGSVSSRATKGGSGVFPLFLVPCPLLEWSAHKQRPLKLLPSRERSFLSPSTRFFHSSLSSTRAR